MLDVAFMNVPYHVLQIKFGLLHFNKQTMCNCKLPAWEYFQCHRVKSTLWLYSLLLRLYPDLRILETTRNHLCELTISQISFRIKYVCTVDWPDY